uniref:PepSY-associated TM helix domain-containing protein n=1 Tax=Roseihalotalea indica TaxID=2867963 RepID=A0AA49JJI1_9BACT|nr:PepSY-associated TM helix domain-containing protein [Tunicatimonas sp. TK19036]
MKFKKLVGKIHLWIGLMVGLPFFVIALSGALYTWAPEMAAFLYQQKVEPQKQDFVSVSDLKATLDREFPQGDFRTAFYRDETSAIEVLLFGQGTYYHAQFNPYTAALIHVQDMNKGGLNYLKFLHRNLMLGKIGQQIVHWITLLFLIMMITGLIIWWPAGKLGRKQRFTIKWGASPKRLTYDLHNVLGFYATWISIFSVITGLFWGFEIVDNTLRATTGENEMQYDIPASDTLNLQTATDQFVLMDSLVKEYRERYPSKFIRISNPHKKTDPINVVVIEPNLITYNTNHYYFNRYTGEPISGNFEYGLHAEASLFHTLHGLVYDIHFGTILGFPGRLLVFFASLIAASLPITGLLIYLNKKR